MLITGSYDSTVKLWDILGRVCAGCDDVPLMLVVNVYMETTLLALAVMAFPTVDS